MDAQALQNHLWLFHRGEDSRAFDFLGAHPDCRGGAPGTVFRVWAPEAASAAVILYPDPGEDPETEAAAGPGGGRVRIFPMEKLSPGVWEAFGPGAGRYAAYQYRIRTSRGEELYKSDPFAFHTQTRPGNASKVYDVEGYPWTDGDWLQNRSPCYDRPLNIYEVHLGSWRRGEEGEVYTYARKADELPADVRDMGYTHAELLPVTEHPLDGSWGYQCLGYFAPTSRFGTPHDFMRLIDRFHAAGVGVILDWAPAHFPKDAWGLARFDGTPLYEGSDPARRERPDWGTLAFDYGRGEVRSFLVSSALFWLEKYHADGFRVDAVASMLYLDFGREPGQWRKNVRGGRENLEAVDFLRQLNTAVFARFPAALMMAEESSAWPLVTRPVHAGGLGFNNKWNKGWMNDTLRYFSADPAQRPGLHERLTFSLTYAFSENFVLPLSHDEVVHLKRSLLSKMPGDEGARFAGLRSLYAYMAAHPGKKLLFMGGEFGQVREWGEARPLDWELLKREPHRQLWEFVRALNRVYRENPPFWDNEGGWEGFRWISCDDRERSLLSFRRIGKNGDEIIVVCNFSAQPRPRLRVGLPGPGSCERIFSTSPYLGAEPVPGGRKRNGGRVRGRSVPWDGLPCSMELDLPPLSVLYLRFLPAPAKKTPPAAKKAVRGDKIDQQKRD